MSLHQIFQLIQSCLKLVTAEGAIKAACSFAKISDLTIDKELIDEPGKLIYLSSSDPEILLMKVCKVFEIEFSKKFNFKHSVMVNSGSSANLVMFAALKKYFGWKDGDEIIVCACGFVTTIAPIVQSGLKPVFVDIDWEDLNWDLEQVESKITDRTVGAISSPVLGNPYDVSKFVDLCRRKNIAVIADNCDSLGSTWKGNYLTDYAVAASCSFYPAHHICTMEGGMVSSMKRELLILLEVLLGGVADAIVLVNKIFFLMVFVERDLILGWKIMKMLLTISMSFLLWGTT